ncbi:MAG TPA: DUF2461 domain-containing protein [Gemmatimonadaceae bacterium]|nr:DUF2461 domain-containing protein [Gemmatimonadaceae bacterium]
MNIFPGFTPEALTFLRQLKRHNDREWFKARKARFDELLLEPMKLFVEEMDVRLASAVPEIHGSPRRSIFRIYRDTRFSKDKSPYKTHVACWFSHVRASHGVGSETHGAGAGYYFHLEPGASLVAGGIWMPARPTLAAIRDRIAERGGELKKLLKARALASRFGTLSDEGKLSRVPRGYDKEHEHAELLRHASFTVSASLDDATVLSPKLAQQVEKDFKAMAPLVRWINDALGYPAADRR